MKKAGGSTELPQLGELTCAYSRASHHQQSLSIKYNLHQSVRMREGHRNTFQEPARAVFSSLDTTNHITTRMKHNNSPFPETGEPHCAQARGQSPQEARQTVAKQREALSSSIGHKLIDCVVFVQCGQRASNQFHSKSQSMSLLGAGVTHNLRITLPKPPPFHLHLSEPQQGGHVVSASPLVIAIPVFVHPCLVAVSTSPPATRR